MNTPEKPPPISVLAIDDEQGLRDMLSFGLAGKGYRVVTAANGDDGLAKALTDQFDLVVCDIMMPGRSGMDVLKELKANKPDTEIIMATGHASLETAIESIKLGAYDYITKPYSLRELFLLFDRALEYRRLKTRVIDLEQLHRLKSEFVANTSHELRTPLNAIMGFVSLLLSKVYGDIPSKQAEVLKRVEGNAKNLLGLVCNLLDLSKLSAGKMVVETTSCNLKGLMSEVVAEMESLSAQKKLALTWEVPEDLIVQTDATKLKQILVNLLGNAFKFTSQGGVSVRASLSTEGQGLDIAVKDTGIGIRQEDIALLFQEFKQVDASTTRKYGGTGLGLSISQKLAHLLGGYIGVTSAAGLGSTFTLHLPLKVGSGGRGMEGEKPGIYSSQNSSETCNSSKKGRILLVEDDSDSRQLAKDVLEMSGYAVIEAINGLEALTLVSLEKPDLVLLDMSMPEMNGWEVSKRIRADPAVSHIKIVALSAHASGGDAEKARKAGCDDYLAKPYNPNEMITKVAAWLADKSHSAAA